MNDRTLAVSITVITVFVAGLFIGRDIGWWQALDLCKKLRLGDWGWGNDGVLEWHWRK
jgi:hypothetical protein